MSPRCQLIHRLLVKKVLMNLFLSLQRMPISQDYLVTTALDLVVAIAKY